MSYYGEKPSTGYWGVPAIVVWVSNPTPWGTACFGTGNAFYRLGCGQTLRGRVPCEGTADLTVPDALPR